MRQHNGMSFTKTVPWNTWVLTGVIAGTGIMKMWTAGLL
jgi:hypothetical protein